MAKFSQNARRILSEGGWYEGRKEPVSPMEQQLSAKGYPISDAVRQFLSEFGGLEFETANDDDWHFDPVQAMSHTTPDNVGIDSGRAGAQLCPIGEANRGHLLLMMDPKGRMFGSYDDLIGIVGESPTEAIESLCEGRDLKPIELHTQ